MSRPLAILLGCVLVTALAIVVLVAGLILMVGEKTNDAPTSCSIIDDEGMVCE